MLSDTAEYALRATLYIARQGADGSLVRTDDIAEALDVPRNSLSKILHILGRAECSARNPCPAHHRWAAIGSTVRGFCGETSLADLLREGGSLR